MTLFEIDFSNLQYEWFNYAIGTWAFSFTATYSWIDSLFLIDAETKTATLIESVQIDNEIYTKALSLSDCVSAQKTFFYDGSDKTYIHFEGNKSYSLFSTISIGVVQGFSESEMKIGDTQYRGVIKTIGSVNKSLDNIFTSKISFQDFSINFSNLDAYFDTLIEDNTLYGAKCRIKYCEDCGISSENYKTLWSGYIGNFEIGTDEAVINAKDDRNKLSKELILNYYNTTTYPYLNSTNIGKPIPIVYGTLRGVPTVCTNETESIAANYNFKVCDTTFHNIASQTVNVLKDNNLITSTTLNIYGEFTLTTGQYNPGDNITIESMTGYIDDDSNLITNSVEIIKDILLNYLDITNIASYYNDFKIDNGHDQYVYINSETKIYEVIEQLAYSDQAVFYIEFDGRYSYVVYDTTIIADIKQYAQLSKSNIYHDTEKIITTAIVKYSENISSASHKRIIDDSEESTLYDLYSVSNVETFTTTLVNESDAEEFATNILDNFGTDYKTTTINIHNSVLMNFVDDLKMRKSINFDYNRINDEMYGSLEAEIIGFSFNLLDNTTSIQLRIVD